jgi:trimethylamine--corrinoid protein Co-methyltransferase
MRLFALDDTGLARIAADSLDLLDRMRIKVDSPAIRSRLAERGCRVDEAAGTVRFAPDLVQWALAQAPEHVTFADRAGRRSTVGVAGGNVVWTTNAVNVLRDGRYAPIDAPALAELARVADACPEIAGMVTTSIRGVPSNRQGTVGFRLCARHTAKHLRPVIFSTADVAAFMEMTAVLLDGRTLAELPLASAGYSIVAPGHWTEIGLAVIEGTSGRGMPLMLNAEVLAGGFSPVTLAGSLVLANAEVLTGVAIAQVLEPGRPVIHNIGFSHVMDMRTTNALCSSPGCMLLAAGGAQLARHFGLPSASWASSDACALDPQLAGEKAMQWLAHLAAGVNLLWGAGSLEGTMAVSPELLVLDDEFLSAARHVARGIGTSDQQLARDAIAECADSGDFLSSDHTLAHFRSELHRGRLVNRDRRAGWLAAGAKDLLTRARERVAEILAAEPAPILSDPQHKELLRIEAAHLKNA